MEKYIKNRIEEWIKKPGKKSLILYGPPGSGKTYIIHKLSQKLKMKLFDIDIYENEVVLSYPEKFPSKSIVLFDNLYKDIPTRKIIKFIKKTKARVVLIFNESRDIPQKLKVASALIYIPRPSYRDIVNFAKKIGLKDFNNLTRDFRQIIYKLEYKSQGYIENRNLENIILDYFNTGNVEFDLNLVTELVLLRNAVSLYGVDSLEKIERIKIADIIGNTLPLENITWNVKSVDTSIIDRLSEVMSLESGKTVKN